MNASETYEQLLGTKKEIISSLRCATGCDITDVLTAVACGSIGGMIDVFLVGAPGDGKPLEAWSDSQVDNAVKKFAEICGWDSSDPDKGTVAYAIDHLEKMFKVNYDQRYGADVGGLFDMSTTNHHMKSLAHSPSPVGLFFLCSQPVHVDNELRVGWRAYYGKNRPLRSRPSKRQGFHRSSRSYC